MVDFKAALSVGMAAHDQAEADRKEILSVVADLGAQAKELTGGKATIVVATIKREKSMAEVLSDGGSIFGRNSVEYDALVVESTSDADDFSELCTWSSNDGGYPVTIRFNDNKWGCHDRASLEEALQSVVSTPAAGRALAERSSASDD
nr:hypothetical protein [Pseudomonas corrugata]